MLGIIGGAAGLGALGYGVAESGYFDLPEEEEPVRVEHDGPFRNVYVVSRTDQTDVDVYVIYPYGERLNPMDEGLAHYLEHLAWESAYGFNGGIGGHSNAWTTNESTSYWLSKDPNRLREMIEALASTAAPLNVTEDFANQERGIVEREFDLRRGEDPLEPVWNATAQALYGETGYGRSVLGTRESIAEMTLARAKQLHDATHQLQSATLFVRGPVSAVDVQKAVNDVSAWPEPRAELLTRETSFWPAKQEMDFKSQEIAGIGEDKLIRQYSYLPPPDMSYEAVLAAQRVLVKYVKSTKAGSLSLALKFDQFVARSFEFGLTINGQGALEMWIVAAPDVGVSLEELDRTIQNGLKDILSKPSEKSVKEIQSRDRGGLKAILDRQKTNADWFLDAQLYGQPFVSIEELQSANRSLNHSQFNSFTQHLLNPRTVAVRHLTAI